MTDSQPATLLCWHAARAGFDVLDSALKGFTNRRIPIGRVVYLVQSSMHVDVPDERCGVPIQRVNVVLDDPANHRCIRDALNEYVLPEIRDVQNLHVNISPGTPAMHAVWMILHAGGALPPGTRLWSSQQDPKTKRRSLPEVEIPITTYLREIRELAARRGDTAAYAPDTTKSPARREALERVGRFARVGRVPILVIGERGTGKSRLVETMIRALKGKNAPFEVVACGSMESELFESFLFGHAKGAFTGAMKDRKGVLEHASGGTLFLDEVQDMPRPAQRKLVRVLEERRFRRLGEDDERKADVDLVCASNRSLDQIRDHLDADLFDRISHLVVEIPPLRRCREDIEDDWQQVWRQLPFDAALPAVGPWNDRLRDALRTHDLPGNFRDLQRLAALVGAWTNESPNDDAIESALNDWHAWTPRNAEPAAEEARFGAGTARERVKKFEHDLALWAKQRWGTWERAAAELKCGERTLRRYADPGAQG